MATRGEWLTAGLEALIAEGAPGVKIDKLSAELGASKGSYYHHFGSALGYKLALLAEFEARHTSRYIEAVENEARQTRDREGQSPLPPLAKLRRLLDMVIAEHPADGHDALEIAIRAWAHQDADVRAAQGRVDRTRTRYLTALWHALGAGPDESERMGQLLYALLIGGGQVIPPLPAAELRKVYDLALRLAPTDD